PPGPAKPNASRASLAGCSPRRPSSPEADNACPLLFDNLVQFGLMRGEQGRADDIRLSRCGT
ncbi:hypothetical protein, partial [Microvirga vignae]|uniref:hypothetical protein n=1 Tax=Microvirga vignae TaxID=1225564 RepID=UPI001AEC5BCB